MENNYLIIRAVYGSIAASALIILAKVAAWYITDSSTVLASLMDSLFDISASFVNFIAAKYSIKPPDNEYRFGRDRVEDLAVFTQSTFFGLSGIFIIIVSIKKLFYPQNIEQGIIGIFSILFSIVVTLLLITYQSYVFRKTNSSIVKTDRLHYSVDLMTNCAVILSLYLSGVMNSKIIDPIFAILIAFYVLYGAVRLFSGAMNNLMDREFKKSDKEKLRRLIFSNKKVKGYHDLKTRYAGRKPFIQFHLELDGAMSLRESHSILEEIEKEIATVFKDAEVIIHQDPEGIDEAKQFDN